MGEYIFYVLIVLLCLSFLMMFWRINKLESREKWIKASIGVAEYTGEIAKDRNINEEEMRRVLDKESSAWQMFIKYHKDHESDLIMRNKVLDMLQQEVNSKKKLDMGGCCMNIELYLAAMIILFFSVVYIVATMNIKKRKSKEDWVVASMRLMHYSDKMLKSDRIDDEEKNKLLNNEESAWQMFIKYNNEHKLDLQMRNIILDKFKERISSREILRRRDGEVGNVK